MHAFERFIHPRIATVLPAFIVTGIAAFLLYYSLNCALDGSGQCWQLPVAVQIVLIGLLWPWGLMMRFLVNIDAGLAGVTGFAFSFVWIYLLLCCLRLIVDKMWKTRGKHKKEA